MQAIDASQEKPKVRPGSSSNSNDEEAQPQKGTVTELDDLTALGYTPELQRNRGMFTLLFQSLAIAAVSPFFLINPGTRGGRVLGFITSSHVRGPPWLPFLTSVCDPS